MAASFLYGQLFVRLPYPTEPQTGKTVVITGANSGLGKQAAQHFVRLGAGKVILAVRDLSKGITARQDIERATGCQSKRLEVWQVDMASYASVTAFGTRAAKELDRIDIFLANAGIGPAKYAVAEDNEASITVNVVSTLLLAALVWPKMKETANRFRGSHPTFSITSSGVHAHTTVPQRSAPEGQLFATINDKQIAEKHWSEQYPISKLLEVFGVRAIAEKYETGSSVPPVTINVLNPGLCHSDLGRDFPSFAFWFVKAVLARSTEAGSRTLVHAGTCGPESHGQYLSNCQISSPDAIVTCDEGRKLQERVWVELTQKLETISPGVVANFEN